MLEPQVIITILYYCGYMYEIKTQLLRYKKYYGLHTTGFVGVTFQVSTSDAIICINFLKLEVFEVTSSARMMLD